MKRFSFAIIGLTFGLSACGPGPKQPATGPYRTDFNERFERRAAPASWSPVNVTVTCGTTACPPQVGVVIFATPKRDGRGVVASYDLKRCTGSLIAPDRVLTNAHCLAAGADAYFIMPSGPSRIADVVFQTGGTNDTEGNPIAVADAALLRLDRPVTGVPPLKVATGLRPSYASLSAYVSNRASSGGESAFRIDRFDCAVRRTRGFPYAIGENPDVIVGFDCVGQHGNSGSPLLGPDGSVEAVLQTTGAKTIVAANVRCLPLTTTGAAACVPTLKMTQARQESRSLEGWNRIGKSDADEDVDYPYRFKRQRLKLAGTAEAYEVIRLPTCLRNDTKLSEIKYPTETVTITRDANDNVVTTTTNPQVTVARVLAQQGDRYQVEANWAPSAGRLEREDQHPRAYLGKTFSVDLLRCAR